MEKKLFINKRFVLYSIGFSLFVSAIVTLVPSRVFAQVPSMVCLGTCPTPTTATTNVAAEVAATTPTTGVSITPTANPSITQAQTPSSTPVPCKQPDIYSLHSAGNTEDIEHNRRRWRGKGGKGTGGSQGIIQLLLNLLQQILQLIQQLLGIGGGGGSTSITPIKTTPMVTANPCPSNTPGTQPTSSTTATTAPSSSVTTTVAPSSSVTATVGPTQSGPTPTGQTASPAPKDGGNYSGYFFHITSPAVGDTITSTFTAVAVTCGTGFIAPWPGMGDTWDVEKNLAQLGIDIQCSGSTTKYATWTEALPAGSVYPGNVPIKQGDSITASVTYQGGGKFTTNIKDTTAGWSLDTPMNYAASYVPVGAEVINEEVGGGGVMQFSPINFVNTLTIGGQQVQMAAQPSLTRLNMTHATTSDLTGSNFTSTYK